MSEAKTSLQFLQSAIYVSKNAAGEIELQLEFRIE
jgi:hypothetical protein